MFVKTPLRSPSRVSDESGNPCSGSASLTCHFTTFLEMGNHCQNYESQFLTDVPDIAQPFHDFAVPLQELQPHADNDSNLKLFAELSTPVTMASESSLEPPGLISRTQQDEPFQCTSYFPSPPSYVAGNTTHSTGLDIVQVTEDSNSSFSTATDSAWYSHAPATSYVPLYYMDQLVQTSSTVMGFHPSNSAVLFPDQKHISDSSFSPSASSVDQLAYGRPSPPEYYPKKRTTWSKRASSNSLVSNASLKSIGEESLSADVPSTATGKRGAKRKWKDSGETCAVCNDVSSGMHYGVQVCEGCKNFFKRSSARIQKGLQPPYVCLQVRACSITAQTRNQCKACRLHKCFAMGMSHDSRSNSPHVIFHNATTLLNASSSNQEKTPAGTRKFALSTSLDFLTQVITAHSASFTPVPSVMLSRYANLNTCLLSAKFPPECDLSQQGAENVRNYADNLPLFKGLPPSIQATLMNHNMVDIMVLRTASRYCPERSSYVFPMDNEMTEAQFKRYPLGLQIHNRIRSLSRSLMRLGIGDTEMSFLSVFMLLSPHTPELRSVEQVTVAEIYAKLLRSLKRHLKIRQSRPMGFRYKLLCLLPEIKATALCIPKSEL